MSRACLLAFAACALALSLAFPALGADLPPIDRLQPLPLSFWTQEAGEQAEAVRSAYLRGFFEATHVWAVARPQEDNPARRYLQLIQGMNLVQVSNLLHRLIKEHPRYADRLTLGEALTGCVVRARTGLPMLDEETARRWGLESASARKAKGR